MTLREKCTHSYELMEWISPFGFEQIHPATLYRTLGRMENEELCESEWETDASIVARSVGCIGQRIPGKHVRTPGLRHVSTTKAFWTRSPGLMRSDATLHALLRRGREAS